MHQAMQRALGALAHHSAGRARCGAAIPATLVLLRTRQRIACTSCGLCRALHAAPICLYTHADRACLAYTRRALACSIAACVRSAGILSRCACLKTPSVAISERGCCGSGWRTRICSISCSFTSCAMLCRCTRRRRRLHSSLRLCNVLYVHVGLHVCCISATNRTTGSLCALQIKTIRSQGGVRSGGGVVQVRGRSLPARRTCTVPCAIFLALMRCTSVRLIGLCCRTGNALRCRIPCSCPPTLQVTMQAL